MTVLLFAYDEEIQIAVFTGFDSSKGSSGVYAGLLIDQLLAIFEQFLKFLEPSPGVISA
jgi:hypothetical protein